MKYIIIIQHIQHNVKRNLTKKYRISADCGNFIQLQVSKTRVVEALDGLPPVKIHCSVLAEEAVQAALEDYRKRQAAKAEGQADPPCEN